MSNPPSNYAEAQRELQSILEYLQSPEANVDHLAEKVARARELVEWSRAQLRATEEQVNGLLGELDS